MIQTKITADESEGDGVAVRLWELLTLGNKIVVEPVWGLFPQLRPHITPRQETFSQAKTQKNQQESPHRKVFALNSQKLWERKSVPLDICTFCSAEINGHSLANFKYKTLSLTLSRPFRGPERGQRRKNDPAAVESLFIRSRSTPSTPF